MPEHRRDQHGVWRASRSHALTEATRAFEDDDEPRAEAAARRAAELEGLLADTPAVTVDGVRAQLALAEDLLGVARRPDTDLVKRLLRTIGSGVRACAAPGPVVKSYVG